MRTRMASTSTGQEARLACGAARGALPYHPVAEVWPKGGEQWSAAHQGKSDSRETSDARSDAQGRGTVLDELYGDPSRGYRGILYVQTYYRSYQFRWRSSAKVSAQTSTHPATGRVRCGADPRV